MVISKPDNAPVQFSTPGLSEESLSENDNQVETTSSTSNVTKRKKEKYAHLKKKRLSYPAKLSRIEKKE